MLPQRFLDNGIGNRLLEFVYALSPNKPFVHFEVILDKDGNPEMSYIGMNYGERGKNRLYSGGINK